MQSVFTKLVQQGLPEVRKLHELQRATGVSGELDVTVHAPDLTDPKLIDWMTGFKKRVLSEHGFRGEFPSCRKAEICPGPSPTDFFTNPGEPLTSSRIEQVFSAIPAYDRQAVLSSGARSGELGHTANISFGIRVMPLADQQKLIDDIRDAID